MSIENVSKELIKLANSCLSNKADSDELYHYIKNILDINDYILDEILEECMVHTNNYEIINMLQQISEVISYCKSIDSKDGQKYFANLFAIPIVYVKDEGTVIEPIQNFKPELEEISKALRTCKVFDHECKIHIHNALFSPQQLMVLNYNFIYSFLNEMTNLCFNKPSNILEAPRFEQEFSEESSLHIQYLFGIRVFKTEAEKLNADEEFAVLSDFNEKVNPILAKVLDGRNISIIAVDEFYPAIQAGLEFHTSVSRKISIEQQLSDSNVPAEYCSVLIVIDTNDFEDSHIELTSTMNNEVIGKTEIYPLKHQDPKQLIGTITEELAEIGFEMENIQIKAENAIYPIDFFLKYEEEFEIATAVNNFLDNPNIDN